MSDINSVMHPDYVDKNQLNLGQQLVADTLGKPIDDVVQGKYLEGAAGLAGLFAKPLISLLTYSPEAEAIPSNTMKQATKLSDVFIDWFKGGKPTVNIHQGDLPEIIKSGKLKNQMELTEDPIAWDRRLEVEKNLGGIPKAKSTPIIREDRDYLYELLQNGEISPEEMYQLKHQYIYSTKDGTKRPIYGHIYNPEYTHPTTANMFGKTYLEMSDKIKDNSRYILGDSFDPFVNRTFDAKDMTGQTSALERALFSLVKRSSDPIKGIGATRVIDKLQKGSIQEIVPYMEMWIPNSLSRINNIKSVNAPYGSASIMELKKDPLYLEKLREIAKEMWSHK